MQIAVEIAHEGVGEAVGKGLEPGLAVIVAGDVRQRLRAVVGHAHQHRRARPRCGMSDDRERSLRGRLPGAERSITTGLRGTPISGTSTSTTSPCFMFSVAPAVPV